MEDMTSGMYLLVELNQQLVESVCQLRVSHVHGQDNPIVIDEPEDDVLNLAPVQVPAPVQYQLVPIDELTESVGDSEEEGSRDEEVEVWEIPREEFEEGIQSSSPKV